MYANKLDINSANELQHYLQHLGDVTVDTLITSQLLFWFLAKLRSWSDIIMPESRAAPWADISLFHCFLPLKSLLGFLAQFLGSFCLFKQFLALCFFQQLLLLLSQLVYFLHIAQSLVVLDQLFIHFIVSNNTLLQERPSLGIFPGSLGSSFVYLRFI